MAPATQTRNCGFKCSRISCPSPAAGNGIFGCGDRPPKIATEMGERSQRQNLREIRGRKSQPAKSLLFVEFCKKFLKKIGWTQRLDHEGPSIRPVRCAIYTRVSTEYGLDHEFNSLDAQYDTASAYIKSQAHAGWTLIRSRYDDGGYSVGSTDRPDLQRLLDDIRSRKLDVIVVYKVDRLTRSLADFAKLVELFDAHGVSFVSVTQQFNTTTSMGRLTLNVLLSFAQFERV